MRTVRTKVYQFSELSDKAKQVAIDNKRYINVEHEWHDLTTDEQAEELTKQGFKEPKIMFSGFSSQGDGACFTCSGIDFDIFLNGKYKGLDISADITHNYRYYFATSTTVNLNGDEITEELYSEIEKAIKERREELGNQIYRILEKEYDYLTTDTAITETIEANEYEFTQEGKIFHA